MPENLNETATFEANVSVPVDGVDRRTALSLRPAFQALANRTRNLLNRLVALEGLNIGPRLSVLESGSSTIFCGRIDFERNLHVLPPGWSVNRPYNFSEYQVVHNLNLADLDDLIIVATPNTSTAYAPVNVRSPNFFHIKVTYGGNAEPFGDAPVMFVAVKRVP